MMRARKEFLVFNAGISALLISFLVESLTLRIFYSILFFWGVYYLQILLFSVDENATTQKQVKRVLRNKNLLVYALGFTASIIVLTFPPYAASPGSQPLHVVFAKIQLPSLIRALSGYFLLGVFPGYVIFSTFLSKHEFDIIEEIGLILALSYAINGFIGSLLLALHPTLFSPSLFLLVLWGSILSINVVKRLIFHKGKYFGNCEDYRPLSSASKRTLFFASLLILTSSFTLVFSCDVGDPALSGDITRYISTAIAIWLGQRPLYLTDRPLFLVFPLVAHLLTGLHPFYAYAGLQFYLLMIPSSFYIILKSIFRQDRKIPAVGAFLASVTSGLGFIGLWDFLPKYVSGGSETYSALIDAWRKAPLTFVSYQFYVMPLAYSLLFMALSFMYRYVFTVDGKRRLSDLLLCGLLAALLPFTHSIFEFSFFIVSLIICFLFFAPINRSSVMASLSIIVAVMAFFAPLEFTFGTYRYTFINYFFHIKHFFGYPTPSIKLVVLPVATIATCILLRVHIHKHKPHISFQHYGKTIFNRPMVKLAFWVVAFVFLFLTMYYWRINWADLNVPHKMEWPPWYIIVMSYGIYPTLAIGLTPSLLTGKHKKNLLIILSWLMSISVLVLLSTWLPKFFTPMAFGRRWLFFAFYPLVALVAAALSKVSSKFPDLNFHVILQMKSKIKSLGIPDLRHFASSILILLISFSFLTCSYTTERFYTGALRQANISSAEGEAYEWIRKNTPENATFLTFSDASYGRVRSLGLRKAVSYSEAYQSWPLQVVFNSYLPEVTMYSLEQLGVSYIFVGPKDMPLLTRSLQGAYINSLLGVLPIVYRNEDVTIYNVPKYPLYVDSNYVLVRPTLDFQNITVAKEAETFFDDFTAGLEKWTILSGEWEIKNGALYEPGKGAWLGKWGLVVSNYSFTNFILEYKAKSMRTEAPYYVWGIFRYLDENNRYFLYIGEETYQLSELVNGVGSVLAAGRHGLNLNLTQWINVKIEAVYSTVKLYINGVLIAMAKGTGLKGRIGLLTHGGYPTCYDDVRVTSLIVPVDSQSALSSYHLSFNILLNSGIKFTVVSDVNLSSLESGKVYVFPYNQHVPSNVILNLYEFIADGAHIIFLDPLFGVYDELSPTEEPILSSMLGASLGGLVSCSGVSFRGVQMELGGKYNIQRLAYKNDLGIEIIANYTWDGQSQTPYIIRKQIGRGTITYMHLTDFVRSSTDKRMQSKILKASFHEVVNNLPKPVEARNAMPIPLPLNLYRYLYINDIPALLSMKDLYGYVYAYSSPISINGLCTISSDYVLMTMDRIHVEELKISSVNGDYTFVNETLSNLKLRGLVNLTLKTSNVNFLSRPYHTGEVITVSARAPFIMNINLVNAELQFERNETDLEHISVSDGRFTIVVSSLEDILLALRQPLVRIDGSVNLNSWQGIFWYKDKAVMSPRIHSCVIRGTFYIQIPYSFGGILFKVKEVSSIRSLEWQTLS